MLKYVLYTLMLAVVVCAFATAPTAKADEASISQREVTQLRNVQVDGALGTRDRGDWEDCYQPQCEIYDPATGGTKPGYCAGNMADPCGDCNGDGICDDFNIQMYYDGAGSPGWGDCNGNHVPDMCDIAEGISTDCNTNGIPDECEDDCNSNGVADECDILDGTSTDCNGNMIPDECDISGSTSEDCNNNQMPDSCDLLGGTSADCWPNNIPDECEPDCNGNSVPDNCDIRDGVSEDCNTNAVPDECDVPPIGSAPDCDGNLMPDECQPDDDGDTIINACDNCPSVSNPDQANSDTDMLDSYGDACDNCPLIYNEDQLNSDSDSHGDACDNCLMDDNEDQADTSEMMCCWDGLGPVYHLPDGVGDACDVDPCYDDNNLPPDQIISIKAVIRSGGDYNPNTEPNVLDYEPLSAETVAPGLPFYLEIWAQQTNPTPDGETDGLNCVYVDISLWDGMAQLSGMVHEYNVPSFDVEPRGEINADGDYVDHFGGCTPIQGGVGVSPEWARIGWMQGVMPPNTLEYVCLGAATMLPAGPDGDPGIPCSIYDFGFIDPLYVNYMTCCERADNSCKGAIYDFNGDGYIGDDDFQEFLRCYGLNDKDGADDFDTNGQPNPNGVPDWCDFQCWNKNFDLGGCLGPPENGDGCMGWGDWTDYWDCEPPASCDCYPWGNCTSNGEYGAVCADDTYCEQDEMCLENPKQEVISGDLAKWLTGHRRYCDDPDIGAPRCDTNMNLVADWREGIDDACEDRMSDTDMTELRETMRMLGVPMLPDNWDEMTSEQQREWRRVNLYPLITVQP